MPYRMIADEAHMALLILVLPRGMAAIGLLLDLVGALLLARDFWFRRMAPDYADDLSTLIVDLARSISRKELDAARDVKNRAYAFAMESRAKEALDSRGEALLRRSGRIGLVLLAVGFLLQLAAALLAPPAGA